MSNTLFMKNLFPLLLAVVSMLVGSFSGCQPVPQKVEEPSKTLSEGTWEALAASDGSTPVARHEAAFVGVGDKFYLIGGRGDRPTSIFDTKTQTWTNTTPPPLEMHHTQPVVYQGKVYILGAMTGPFPGETPIPNIYIYDPSDDSWTKGPEIPEDRRRGGAGAVVYQDKFYLACGIKDGHRGDHKTWLDVFDPVTETWEMLPDAPRARDHFQAIAADGKLYMLGGRTTQSGDNSFKNTISEVDVYDIQTKTWSTLENGLPTERAGNYVVLVGEEILVLGGESFNQTPAHAEVEALNVKTHTWRTLAPMLQGRHGTGAVLFQDKVYVASGSGNRGGGPELTTMEVFSW